MLSLIIGISVFAIPSGLTDDELFSHFLPEAIALLQQGSTIINHFGLVPDNGLDEIDDLLVDGVLFRFDVPQIILGILQDAEPLAVKQAFLTLIENTIPVYSVPLEEQGDFKNEKTIVFDFGGL